VTSGHRSASKTATPGGESGLGPSTPEIRVARLVSTNASIRRASATVVLKDARQHAPSLVRRAVFVAV
jgi:hypothetical protein